jgi:benzoyl-CoA reductase/2-hydroxyglutaryl-CoA dehydratase subunit BcrC/BadD/HgdB
MSPDYHQMWSDLNLDLEAHDTLVDVLNQAYQDIFISQKHRPEGMQYFDFVMSEVHGLRIKELLDAKDRGRKVIGSFCVFVPEELILAVNAISVGLCAGAEFGFAEAEIVLPRNTCSLIKSAFGFKLGSVCPYVEASDMIVGENTCDGKKKSYEILSDLVHQPYIMDLPQMKSENGKVLLKSEYIRFIETLQDLTGNTINTQTLKKPIPTVNQKRRVRRRLTNLKRANPVPISGLDSLLINQVFFYDDPVKFTDSVHTMNNELAQRIENNEEICPATTPRVVVKKHVIN